jgi:hypothetical protein
MSSLIVAFIKCTQFKIFSIGFKEQLFFIFVKFKLKK